MDNSPKLYFYNAVVTSIYDGDTIRANIDLGFNTWIFNQKLRLVGIDTPEIRGKERPQGLLAKDFVIERIPVGSEIYVMTQKDKTEKYGRYLATIFYGGSDMKNLNVELLESGHAESFMS
jgi:micrococcal nuclease